MRIYTKTLSSGTLVLVQSDACTQISVQANSSSSCTVLGDFPFQGALGNAITINDGQSFTLMSQNGQAIYGITITWVSGTIDVLVGF